MLEREGRSLTFSCSFQDTIQIKTEIKEEVFPDEFEIYDVQMIDDCIKIEVMTEDVNIEPNHEVTQSPATLRKANNETMQRMVSY